MFHYELILIFFIIAFIYASVGFGGGSSYLAILSLYELPFREIRLTALVCNIIVVTGGTIVFILNKQINWKKILPLVIFSIPMAFFGSSLRLKEHVFFLLLGVTLLVASILLWMRTNERKQIGELQPHYVREGGLGGGIGFLSGMVGIGGGIFLSPLLNLMGWDTPRKIAATASIFILVNSIAGIAGQLISTSGQVNGGLLFFLAAAVLAGGLTGSRLSMRKFDHLVVRRLTACLVFVAGVEVLYKHIIH
jgi:uncharacterized membrane protein YfcA